MSTSTPAAESKTISTAAILLGGGGLLLWAAGAAVGFSSTTHLALALRLLGLVFCAIATVRRSSLLSWTLLSMLAGIELGLDAPHVAAQTRFLGDLFLRLIRMIVAPLLFATITTGIAGHGELRSIGRVALKAIVYFEIVTTLGLILGAIAMNLSGAGWGVALPPSQIAVPVTQAAQTWQQIVLNIFPENIAQAVAQNQVLQVAIFSVLFASALAMLPASKRAPLLPVLQALADVMFQITRFVMLLAPLAAGAALAATVGGVGLRAMLPLANLGITYYLA
ncbi:MAG TPA: cation:dicarboxylase symporter family transporter, partial [Terracidiphilus sp.]|nr:cation:dicarboxylase symporter family transporter [Terracidiphilus sp.]